MPTVSNVEKGLTSAFGASPRTVTITAPTSGNSIGLVIGGFGSANITGVTCGDGTATGLIRRDRAATGNGIIELWIVSGITTTPTSVSISFDGGGSVLLEVDKLEFAGSIEQDNTQEGNANGFTGAEIGPSLTSTASGVGGFGNFNLGTSQTVTGSTGITANPGTSAADHLIYSASLGAAGTYTFGGTPGASANCEVTAVLIKSAGAGGPSRPVIFAGPSQRANN